MKTRYKFLGFIFLIFFILQPLIADNLNKLSLDQFRERMKTRAGTTFTLKGDSLQIYVDRAKLQKSIFTYSKDYKKDAPTLSDGSASVTIAIIILKCQLRAKANN